MDEVSNQTIGMILTLTRKTAFFDQKVKSSQWDFRLGIPIYRTRGKTLGLVGCGKIGFEVAQKISAFGVRVICFDPYLQSAPEGIELTDLDTVLKESDFISIHCPLNDSTRHLIGQKEFKKMAKKPILINTSRGPIIDEKALIQALTEGLVSGAGLDVLEKDMKNGRKAIKGRCPTCGVVMFKILGGKPLRDPKSASGSAPTKS